MVMRVFTTEGQSPLPLGTQHGITSIETFAGKELSVQLIGIGLSEKEASAVHEAAIRLEKVGFHCLSTGSAKESLSACWIAVPEGRTLQEFVQLAQEILGETQEPSPPPS